MKLRNLLESPASKYLNEDGDIILSHQSLSVLPRDLPTKVDGGFYCDCNQLTSLQYCPSFVGRDFSCYRNQLTSLQYCPSFVGGDFYCRDNQLTSLQYCPSFVGGNFYCPSNKLKTLRYLPKEIGEDIDLSNNPDCYVELFYLCNVKLGGDLYIDDNRELADLFNKKYKNTGTRGMLKFQNYLEDLYDLT